MGTYGLKWVAAMAVAALGLLIPGSSQAQLALKGDGYSLTFQKGWEIVDSPSVVRKTFGMATLGATPGTALPNIDSLAEGYSDSLGGTFTKDSSGVKTIGPYSVHWQKFKYDSLPELSALISEQFDFPVTLKNGSFRVYYLQADGMVFTVAVMSILSVGIPPYGEIETAISTLKLGTQAGIISLARGPGRDLWIRGGRLGGEWLKTNRVFAVDCYDSRGALIGSATHGAEGSWILPASRQEMFVLLRTAYGTSEHFTVHPW